LMLGSEDEFGHAKPSTRTFDQPVVLSADEIHTATLNGISLKVRAGEIVGIGGVLGSGASDVPKALFGAQRRTAGTISVDGRRARLACPADAIRAGIGYVPEDRSSESVFPDQSISENLAIARLHDHWKRGRLSSQSITRSAFDAIEVFGVVAESSNALMSTLSGGNQQKVVLARWMARQPKVLLLNEPTAGIDVGARAEIHRVLRAAADSGMSIVVGSSDIDELLSLTDRVVVVAGGRVRSEFKTESLTLHEATELIHA
jgi:ribose transport system ATP-binding protein